MNTWFTVKVKYTKQLDNGLLKRVSEPYLLAAMSFTDAEARIYEELGAVIRGEFHVTNIARTDYHDIFYYDECDTWYKCKITFNSATEDSGKEKRVSQNFLITAYSVKDAYERLKESLASMLVDFEVPSIIISPIVDIFPYNENLDKEISRKPMESKSMPAMDEVPSTGRKVFSASGSDLDEDDYLAEQDFDENEDLEDEEMDSTLEDEYSN